MAQIDTLTNVGAVVSTDLALILRGGANVLGTFGSLVGQNSTAVTITGGTINGTTIGATTPASVAATTLSTTGAASLTNILLLGGTLPGAGNPSISLRSSDNVLYMQSGSANSVTILDSAQNTMQSTTATQHQWNISNVPKMTLDASGNLGVGVVPEAWSAGFTALEVGGFSLLSTNSNFSSSYIQSNAYYDGAWKYKTTGLASQFVQTSGFSTWSHAVSGTADAALTWIEDMRLDVNGRLGIGKTPAYTLDVKDAGAFGTISIDNTGTAGGGSIAFRQNGTQYGVVGVSGAVLGDTSTNFMLFAETSTSIDFANSGVGTVKFRMSSSNFIVGNGGTFSTSAGSLQIEGDGTIDLGIAGTALTNRMQIYNDNGQVGKIQTTGSSTVYATTSDPRLKSAFTKASGALDMIVEAHDNDYIGVFHFLSDPTLTVWGYNAHALVDNQAGFGGTEGTGPRDMTIGDVYEEAVIDEEGNEVTPAKTVQPAGVDPSKRVPLLEAAIYDLLKMNEALTARIEALEGAN
jgi:hypothetical protein